MNTNPRERSEITLVTAVCDCREETAKFLASLGKYQPTVVHDFVIMDDGSENPTREYLLAASRRSGFDLLRNEESRGYAFANNKAAASVTSEWLLFLNNDLVLTKDWFVPFEQIMAGKARLATPGCIGNIQINPRTNNIDHAGVTFASGIPRHFLQGGNEWPKRKYSEFLAVTGACFLIRRELFFEIGGFDENYRTGFEDIDLCLRLRMLGYRHYVANRSRIYHKRGSSTQRNEHQGHNSRVFYGRWGRLMTRFEEWDCLRALSMVSSGIRRFRVFLAEKLLHGSNGFDLFRDLELLTSLGRKYLAQGNGRAADKLSGLATVWFPESPKAWNLHSLCREKNGFLTEAISSCRKALAFDADAQDLRLRLARLLLRGGEAKASRKELKVILQKNRMEPEALRLLGKVRAFCEERKKAVLAFRRSLLFEPCSAQVHANLAEILFELGERSDSLAHGRLALLFNAGSQELRRNMAELYSKTGFSAAALKLLESVVAGKDRCVSNDAVRLGKYAYQAGELIKAEAYFQQSLERDSDIWETFHHLGNVRVGLKSFGAAIDAYERALEIFPDHPPTLSNLANARAFLCDWTSREADIEVLRRYFRRGELEVGAFEVVGLAMDASEVAEANERNARLIREQNDSLRQRLAFRFEERQGGRARVGFLSSDFRNHAVGHLFIGLLKYIDRERFETFVYSTCSDDDSEVWRRNRKAAENFRDLSRENLAQRARRIHADQLDLLVDLGGHSMGANPELLALHPARRQAHYLGYAETLGGGLVNWYIADDYVLPLPVRRYYGEEVVCMPGCFLPPGEFVTPGRRLSRKAAGLPAKGFVFCTFHAAYKLEPQIFRLWMRLLQAVPGSWLWIKCESPEAEKYLRSECLRHGVSPARLLWASKVPERREHVARMSAADLFLDTPAYNAHATAIDALQAGLPILTLEGERFCSRVCGSLLQAMGLGELLCSGRDAYERKAVEIALNPQLAKTLRKRVIARRRKVLCQEAHAARFEKAMEVILAKEDEPEKICEDQMKSKSEKSQSAEPLFSILAILSESEPSRALSRLDGLCARLPIGQVEAVTTVDNEVSDARLDGFRHLTIIRRKVGASDAACINSGIDSSSGALICLLRDASVVGLGHVLLREVQSAFDKPETGMVVLRSSSGGERLLCIPLANSEEGSLWESPCVVIRREVVKLVGGLDSIVFPGELALADLSLRMGRTGFETKVLVLPKLEFAPDDKAFPIRRKSKENFIKRWGVEPLLGLERRATRTWGSENAMLTGIPHREPIARKRSIARNGSFVIHWVIPDFMPGSGGHATIFRMVRHLEEFGHQIKIWIAFSSQHGDGDQVRNLIREHFVEIDAEVGILQPVDLSQVQGDAIFATEWRTAYFVRGVRGVSSRMYFVQDYEPSFFPVGTSHLLADATYDFGLHCVCMGSWLKEKIKRRKIASVEAIGFGYDADFYGLSDSTCRKENVIACYCRTATERRVSELCLIAFSILQERGRDFHVNLFGDSDLRENFPFSHANLGVLSPEALGTLYQECALGVVFSATNVSLIPLEMMACGLPVLELDVEGTRHAFPKEVVSLAKPDPEAIADAVERLLDDKEVRSTQSDQALAYARKMSWEKSARKLESAVRKTFLAKGGNR